MKTWEEIEPLLDSALDLSRDLRADFLAKQCVSDPELHALIECLLIECERDEGFLDMPATRFAQPLIQ